LINYYMLFSALNSAYPGLKIHKVKFMHSKVGWKDPQMQRKFLDEFAKLKRFDPLDDEKWASVSHFDVQSAREVEQCSRRSMEGHKQHCQNALS